MTASVTQTAVEQLHWETPKLRLHFTWADGPVRLIDLVDAGTIRPALDDDRLPLQPLVEVLTPKYGRFGGGNRIDGTQIGGRLRYVEHHEIEQGPDQHLYITQRDEVSGLMVTSHLEVVDGAPAVRATTSLHLPGDAESLILWSVTSLATGAVISDDISALDVWRGSCGWSSEHRWHVQPLRAPGLSRITPSARGETFSNRLAATSVSTYSSSLFVPAGVATLRTSGVSLAWQIEHNGAWHWEVGERPDGARGIVTPEHRVRSEHPAGPMLGDRSHDGAYVALSGPTDQLHNWSLKLSPGDSFTTVPVTVTVGESRDEALGNLARHRRAARRAHPQNESLPVIFNDYMNTLVGDPTEAKLLPLVDAAAAVGADSFCIDAGWYDDSAGWFASVGDWHPSTVRFEHGLHSVLAHIRERGMVPGLWMEPEVVGVDSQAATELPDSAFLVRDGVRIRENGRYFLDLRDGAARAHLDAAVDRLVNELGVGYFKFDYNILPGPGTDRDAYSVGHGLLEHNRAHLAWLDDVLDRHPGLIIENCAGGANRSDFAMLGALQLQSTSDQEDPLLYPAVAVGALAHILPEQAAHWAYPQPSMSDEEISFTMATGLAGRLYLSGVLSGMSEHQLGLVRSAVNVHNETKHALARSIPRFPTGLPTWDDQWVTVAFDIEQPDDPQTLLIVWRLPQASCELTIPLTHLGSATPTVEQLFPTPGSDLDWSIDVGPGQVTVSASAPSASARVFRLRG